MGAVSHKISEPSMEEILASIRRIIADDQEALLEEPRPEPSGDLSPLRNVLDMTERQLGSQAGTLPEPADLDLELAAIMGIVPCEPEAALEPTVAPAFTIEQASPRRTPTVRYVAPRRAVEPVRDEGLLSREADAAVSGAFARLGATASVQSSPKTLEDIAKEMLRPMLKAWLDDNLPDLVERLVQAEIERVSRARR
jgi:uncharacterized protein